MSGTPAVETGARRGREAALGPGELRISPYRGRLSWGILAALLLLGGVLLLYEGRGMTLTFDEWEWALHRRGGSLGTFLDPHNGHLSLVPVTIYKLLFVTAGLRHYAPYRLIVTAAHLGCVTLVFAYARRRSTNAVALLAATLILFLGAAWQNFLWPFQVAWLISIGAGIGALLLLDRRRRADDVGASVLLGCSLASSGIGLPIAAGLCIDVLSGRDRRRRAWIVLAPLAVYGLWWIGYQDAGTTTTAVSHAPAFVAKAASATFAGLAGLSGDTVPFGSGELLTYGPPLAALAAALVIWSLLRRPRCRNPRVAALLGTVIAFWSLAALGRAGLAVPYSSRYIYVGASFAVLLGAELLRGGRVRRGVVVIAALVVLAAVISNLRVLGYAGNFERGVAQLTIADLGALDIGRPLVSSNYVPIRFPGFGLRFTASAFFATQRAIGSPAASAAELATLPEGAREAADAELISIHRLHLTEPQRVGGGGLAPGAEASSNAALRTHTSCLALRPISAGTRAGVELTLPFPGVLIRTQAASVQIDVRRFASSFQSLGAISGFAARMLAIDHDGSSVGWHLRLQTSGPTTICGLR